MKEPYGEGVAIHTEPDSCGDNSNVMAEALTGLRAPINRDVPQTEYRAGKAFESRLPTLWT
jgi:hypothetical protein